MRQTRLVLGLAVLSALTIGAVWAWLGAPVEMPADPLGPDGKLYCVSYAPFRGGQSPLDLTTQISDAQIEDDLTRLSKLTDCVRTYSIDFGLDLVPKIAARYDMKMILGLWLSGHPDKNRYQIATAVALANKYPNTVRAVVVGNEVLLRGEMSATDLAATINAVKARVPVPVTYADVWEFWLRYPALAKAVDFVTIHILPYWEDDPIAADDAAEHVENIRRRVAAVFPGKEILIGEFGWPSAGRMREGALPSLANQASVIQDVLALAKRAGFHVNLIEAFDQPWKRALEGTVGGHWGLFGDASRDFKFAWGVPVSSHRYWIWQALGGVVFAASIFCAALRARSKDTPLSDWLAVTAIATAGGVTIGWAFENASYESFGAGGIVRSLALIAVALAAAPLAADAVVRRRVLPRFSDVLGDGLPLDRTTRALGWVLIAATVLALMTALGLAFDPRYRDFPYAPLTGAIAPLFILAAMGARPAGARGVAEVLSAAVLALCAAFIGWNETLANWQSLWLCGLLVLLAVTLAWPRAARS
jgi:exo-beta-1,3-glucanase (GH17 family)